MKLFIPLTDWTTNKATRGRGVGNEITSRTVLALDSWNWVFGTQRQDKPDAVTGNRFFGNMRCVIPTIVADFKDGVTLVERIIEGLVARTGVKPPTIPPLKTYAEQSAFGRVLDDTYGTSFLREYPPTAYRRIFKEDAADEAEEVAESEA